MEKGLSIQSDNQKPLMEKGLSIQSDNQKPLRKDCQ